MDEANARALVMFINAGMKVLSMRLVLVMSLLMTFGLFVWAMWLPTPERIAAASIFTLGVFLPALKSDFRQSAQEVKQGE
jgi:hypothetical protein